MANEELNPVLEVTESQRKMRGPITEYLLAKDYLNTHKIPQMFDSLMAAIMIEKPDNHFEYLETTLDNIKEIGMENINWETFVHDLHPLRDQNRLKYIHDEFYEKHKSAIEQYKYPSSESTSCNNDESYQPQVFQLTEPFDEDELEDVVT